MKMENLRSILVNGLDLYSWGDVPIRRAPAVWVALTKGVGLHHPDTRYDAGRGCCCACNMR